MWGEGVGIYTKYIRRAEGGEVNSPSSGGFQEYVAEKFFGFDPEDIAWANSLGKEYGESEQLDGRGDAARHLALGWLASRTADPERSQMAIDLREDLDPSNWLEYFRSFRREDGSRPAYEMDIQNNALGATLKASSREEAEALIRAMIENSSAKYMTVDESRSNRGYRDGGGVASLSHIARAM